MPDSAVEIGGDRGPTLNAIRLTSAVLCVECDVVSDSPHDYCLVCGSRSLFNIGRLLGGMPQNRAKVIETHAPAASSATVLALPIRNRPPLRRHRKRFRAS